MPSDTHPQNPEWQHFYESAWRLRLEFVRTLLAHGEKNPYRMCKLLEQYERYNSIEVNGASIAFTPNLQINHTKELRNFVADGGKYSLNPGASAHLPTGQLVSELVPLAQKYIDVPYYYRQALDWFLSDFLRERTFDCVVELGCGYGRNLIELYYAGGPRVPYYGGEYTKSGVELTTLLGALQPELSLHAFHFDHCAPDLSCVKNKNRVFLFTCHSLEQVRAIPANYFDQLAAVAPSVEVIHFEPFGYQMQLGATSEVDTTQRTWFQQRKWNENFLETLIAAHQRGAIDLIYLAKNHCGGNVSSPTSIAHWKTKAR